MRREPTESQLQSMVLDLWRKTGRPGTRVAAIPNAGAFGQPGLTRGLPDLICWGGDLLRGRTLFIELKTKRGTLSRYQDQIRAELTEAGVPYYVCRTFDDACATLVAWRIVRPLGSVSESISAQGTVARAGPTSVAPK